MEIIPNSSRNQRKMFHHSSRLQSGGLRHRRQLSRVSRISRIGSENQACKTTCNENFKRFLVSTTLHGLKYVGDNTITLFER